MSHTYKDDKEPHPVPKHKPKELARKEAEIHARQEATPQQFTDLVDSLHERASDKDRKWRALEPKQHNDERDR